jgi:hypothetical protein
MGFANRNVDLSRTSIRVQLLLNILPLFETGLRDEEQLLKKLSKKSESSVSIIQSKFHSVKTRKICCGNLQEVGGGVDMWGGSLMSGLGVARV